jgi:hypothetical protein
MIQQLSQALNLLEKINKSLETELISSSELADAKDNLVWLERSKENLTTTLQQGEMLSNFKDDKITSKIIVDFNREIGDIAQCIEDMHSYVILAAERYVEFLDNKTPKP